MKTPTSIASQELASQQLLVKLLTDFAYVDQSTMQKSAVGLQDALSSSIQTLPRRDGLLTINIFERGIARVLAAVGNAATESVMGSVEHDELSSDTLREQLVTRNEELARCKLELAETQALNVDFVRGLEAGDNEKLGECTAACLVYREMGNTLRGMIHVLEEEKKVTGTLLTTVKCVFDLKANSLLSPHTAGARIRIGNSETEDTGIQYCTYKFHICAVPYYLLLVFHRL